MTDLTEIASEGQFAKCIRDYFYSHKPQKILETGLYHGTGSTSIIASLIRDIPLPYASFFSIECNIENVEIAHENLTRIDLANFVSVLTGLSIPRSLLPTEDQIKDKISLAGCLGVKLDHEQDPLNGAKYYQKETEKFNHEDILGMVLNNWHYCVDFALLDSGGHLGKIEFDYLISKLKSPCAIALDDTRHIKHFESREMILKDKRFEVIADNTEKYGSMLVKFNP